MSAGRWQQLPGTISSSDSSDLATSCQNIGGLDFLPRIHLTLTSSKHSALALLLIFLKCHFPVLSLPSPSNNLGLPSCCPLCVLHLILFCLLVIQSLPVAMSSTWRRKAGRANPRHLRADDIDLLGLAFNVPTRYEVRRQLYKDDMILENEHSTSDESDALCYTSSTAAYTDDDDDDETTHVLILPTRRTCAKQRQSKQQVQQPQSFIRRSTASPQRESPEQDVGITCRNKQRKHHASLETVASQRGLVDNERRKVRVKTGRKHRKASPSPSPKFLRSESTLSPSPASPEVSHTSLHASSPGVRRAQTPPIIPMQRPPTAPIVPSFQPPHAHIPPVEPTQFTYHTLPVSHTAATYPHTMYFASSSPLPTNPLMAPSQHAHVQSPGSDLESINRLQTKINSLQLDQLRSNKEAHATELKKLHVELNASLDAATLHQREGGLMPQHMSGDAINRKAAGDPSAAEVLLRTPVLTEAVQSHSSVAREGGPSDSSNKITDTAHYHLCSSCGNIRSIRFHEKHPFRSGQKAVLNYCESCRAGRVARDAHEQYHFCSGCGRVRSKVYQEAHPVMACQPMPMNYCVKCVKERRQDHDLEEHTMSGHVSYQTPSIQIPFPR